MASSTSLQVAGLASDFDWKSFVDQIMDVNRAPAKRLEAEKATNTFKSSQLATLGSKLSALKSAASALNTDGLFTKRTAASTTTGSTWSATATSDTVSGSYKVAVTQLATAAKLSGTTDIGSALNPTDDDVAGLTVANLPLGTAITAGKFTVNGQQVTVALTDSLDDVFQAISDATGGDVTASYNHATDKITLTSTNGNVVLGAANDTSNFFRALKLANNGTTSTTSSAKLGSVKTSATLANSNLGGAITNTDSNGDGTFTINGVSIAFNKDTDTLNAVLKRITDSSAGVTASYDAANDRVVLANKSTGDLGVGLSETGSGLLAAHGLTSGTTLTRGQDALFTINGGDTLSSASNTLDASAHGIAGLVINAKTEDTQTIEVKPDTTAMRAKIDAFITKFNDLQQFLDSSTKITTDAKGTVTTAALSDNREIQEWGRSLRTMAFAQVSGLTGSIKRISDLGLDFRPGTNELEVDDETKISDALANSTADVAAFFTTASSGFSTKFDAYLQRIGDQNDGQQTSLTKANTSLDDQIAAIDRRLEQERSVMEAAFIAMETAQSKIKQQQSTINGLWTNSSSSK